MTMDIGEDLQADNDALHRECQQHIEMIARLRNRNAALLGLIEIAYCPVNGRERIRDCQQCGCSAGLFLKDEQKENP